jgi:hypothetical protein
MLREKVLLDFRGRFYCFAKLKVAMKYIEGSGIELMRHIDAFIKYNWIINIKNAEGSLAHEMSLKIIGQDAVNVVK